MAHDSLQSWWNTSLLLVHCRRSLSSSSCRCLSVQVLLGTITRSLLWLNQTDRLVVALLRGIWWRCGLMAWTVHVVVHGWALRERALWILIHLHVGVRRALSLCLSLCCLLRSLPTQCFCSLLLLNARSRGPIRSRSKRHWRDERSGVFRLSDKRMQFRLIWCPSFEGIQVEEPRREIDERLAVGHF